MKKVAAILVGLLGFVGANSRPANAVVLGFDFSGGLYQPRDSRWTGVGIDVAVNAKLSNDLTMGYRVEELNVRGTDSGIIAATGVTDTPVNVVSQVTFQGIQGWYTLARALEDKLSGDLGLWFGAATTSNFPFAVAAALPTATTALTSPFIEPQVRMNYNSKVGSGVDAKFSVGFGYRFVRNWNYNTPFFLPGGIGNGAYTAVTGGSRRMTDFDGADVFAGFGLMF